MRNKIIRALLTVLALGLACAACGAGAQTGGGGRTDCEKQCDLGLMTCLEERVCLDLGGQKIPCMEECESELATCEQACGGR
jgi:hypothetical protein